MAVRSSKKKKTKKTISRRFYENRPTKRTEVKTDRFRRRGASRTSLTCTTRTFTNYRTSVKVTARPGADVRPTVYYFGGAAFAVCTARNRDTSLSFFRRPIFSPTLSVCRCAERNVWGHLRNTSLTTEPDRDVVLFYRKSSLVVGPAVGITFGITNYNAVYASSS